MAMPADVRSAGRVRWRGRRNMVLYVASLSVALSTMTRLGPMLLRWILSLVFGLRKPSLGRIRRLGGLCVPSGVAGAHLSTVAYVHDGGPAPTLLIRTPYGKCIVEALAYAIAAQGFHVVIQDCRGRFDSTGDQTFGAFEDVDGAATVEWLGQQDFAWYDPSRLVMFGISYLGIVQWALVKGLANRQWSAGTDGHPCAKPKLAAIAPLFTASRLHDIFFINNTFRLDFYMRYSFFMIHVKSRLGIALFHYFLLRFECRYRYYVGRVASLKALHKKLGLPIMFKYNPRKESRFWKNRDYSEAIPHAPPALIATGWHDFMLETSLADYQDLVKTHGSGHSRLLVGPWHHLESVSWFAFRFLMATSIDFLKEKTGLLPACPAKDLLPVQLWVMGPRASQGSWMNFSAWPPKEAKYQLMPLTYRTLGTAPCDVTHLALPRTSRLEYNPHDPTPSLGGSLFNLVVPFLAGERHQASLDARADVLKFDSHALPNDMCIVGRARLRLSVRSSRPHFDVFARICDLHPSGHSYNVCDAMVRWHVPSEASRSHQAMQTIGSNGMQRESFGKGMSVDVFEVDLTFAATAKCFKAGHRIRLLVAGGAFPERTRNFGDMEQVVFDEPLEVEPVTLEILHCEQEPSSLWLPILASDNGTAQQARSFEEKVAEQSMSYTKRRRSGSFGRAVSSSVVTELRARMN